MKKSKKGFTLVEIIVVLVIIAILAAIAIPAMTGWIDKANEKAVAAEARTALLAAQTTASETYSTSGGSITSPGALDDDLAGEVPGDVYFEADNGVVTNLLYVSEDGKTASYSSATGWSFE